MSDFIKTVPSSELIDELRARSIGGVFAFGLRGPDSEFITGFDSEHLAASCGLLSIISKRVELYTGSLFDGGDDE